MTKKVLTTKISPQDLKTLGPKKSQGPKKSLETKETFLVLGIFCHFKLTLCSRSRLCCCSNTPFRICWISEDSAGIDKVRLLYRRCEGLLPVTSSMFADSSREHLCRYIFYLKIERFFLKFTIFHEKKITIFTTKNNAN